MGAMKSLLIDGKISTIKLSGDELRFEAIAMTSDYVPAEVLQRAYNTIVGKVINYRHAEPTIMPQALLGEVTGARLEERDGKLYLIVEGKIYGQTEFQREIQKLLRDGKIDGVSVELWYVTDNAGNITDAKFIGLAITPNPQVDEARLLKIYQASANTEIVKSINTNDDMDEKMTDKTVNADASLYEAIRERDAKIAELERKVDELTGVVEFLKQFRERAEALEAENLQLKERIAEMETLPIRKEIADILGDESVIETLKKLSKDELEAMLDALKKRAEVAKNEKHGTQEKIAEPVVKKNEKTWTEDEIRRNPDAYLNEILKSLKM